MPVGARLAHRGRAVDGRRIDLDLRAWTRMVDRVRRVLDLHAQRVRCAYRGAWPRAVGIPERLHPNRPIGLGLRRQGRCAVPVPLGQAVPDNELSGNAEHGAAIGPIHVARFYPDLHGADCARTEVEPAGVAHAAYADPVCHRLSRRQRELGAAVGILQGQHDIVRVRRASRRKLEPGPRRATPAPVKDGSTVRCVDDCARLELVVPVGGEIADEVFASVQLCPFVRRASAAAAHFPVPHMVSLDPVNVARRVPRCLHHACRPIRGLEL